jgi:hypothetical protein
MRRNRVSVIASISLAMAGGVAFLAVAGAAASTVAERPAAATTAAGDSLDRLQMDPGPWAVTPGVATPTTAVNDPGPW